MNIHNHLNPSQIHSTTPIKQGETTTATLKEKISATKAILVIRGQEFQADFTNEIPESEKIRLKVLNVSENTIQVESKVTLRNGLDTQSNNSLQSIETGKIISNHKASGPLLTIMNKKGLQSDIAINNHIKEALSGKFDEHLNLLNKGVFKAIQNEVRVTTNAIKNETNPVYVVKQVNQTLGRIAPFIHPQTSEELSALFKELNVSLSHDKLQNVKDRLIQVLQQVDADMQESTNKAGKEIIFQVGSKISDLHPKEVLLKTKEHVQQLPTVIKVIEKTQEMLKSIALEPKSLEKLERAVQEARQYQQLGREQLGKERIIHALEQIENELSEVITRKADIQLQPKVVIRETREQVQQSANVAEAIEKTQEYIKANPFEPKAIEKLERAIQEAKQHRHLGREQLGKEMIVQALQQLESETYIQDVINKKNSHNEKSTGPNIDAQQSNLKINTTETEHGKVKSFENKTEITKQAVDQWINMIQKQSKIGQALDLLQTELSKYPESASVKKVMESMERAAQHVEAKKELAARKEIHETLQIIKPTLPSESTENQEVQSINKEVKSFIENLPLLDSASKNIVVTKVTEKLAKATIDFKEVQRELVRNLNNVDNMLRTQHTQPQARQLIESTIAKLDNSILKSEMMILSDMGTEKKLLQASSQLAEAKKLLSSGNPHEAQKIVQNVSKLLEIINWKPSEVKVMHYTNVLSDEQPHHYEKQFTKTISTIANYSDMEYGSPREMYEKLRSLGLNYERDIGNYFASNKPEHQLKEIETNNLKYLLQKISSEDGSGKFTQQIEQTLSNITGQQLLSKSDHQGSQQNMMFSLPVQLEQQMKNIKVFVNSKKDGQKVDWENCSLYFLIETPKLGEVGILVSASDRKLSLTLKNNSYDFEQVAKPIGQKAIQRIEEIGYQVNGMKFTDLRKEPVHQDNSIEVTSQAHFVDYTSERGMNFTI